MRCPAYPDYSSTHTIAAPTVLYLHGLVEPKEGQPPQFQLHVVGLEAHHRVGLAWAGGAGEAAQLHEAACVTCTFTCSAPYSASIVINAHQRKQVPPGKRSNSSPGAEAAIICMCSTHRV